jgi:hypothetical protein
VLLRPPLAAKLAALPPPPPAAKRGTEEFDLCQDVPPTKAARVGVTGASSDAANLQGETPPAPKTGGKL